MRLLVLAGGFGTRLQAAVAGVPKALAPIGDVPFLQLQIEQWVAQGLREFTFLLHHEAEQIVDFLHRQCAGILNDCQVDWIVESVPMDTGGAIANAVQQYGLKGNFLVANADTWLGGGVKELMDAKEPVIAVVWLSDVSRYGKVQFNNDDKVLAFVEKDAKRESGWINAGMSCLSAELFDDWNGSPFSLERDLFASLVAGHRLTAIPLKTDFLDIGVPADYYRFCRWQETGRLTPLCN